MRFMQPPPQSIKFLRGRLVSVLTAEWFLTLWAFCTTVFFVVLDVYGEQLKINKTQGPAWDAFLLVVVLQFCLLGLNCWRSHVLRSHVELHRSVIFEIGRFAESLTSTRKHRLIELIQDRLPACLCPEATEPATTINEVLTHIQSSLLHDFKLDAKQLDIHVIGKHPDSTRWAYLFHCRSDKSRTPADIIMSNPSVARQALNDRRDIFYPDKRNVRTSDGQQYFQSNTDQQFRGIGSIFVRPIHIELSTGQEHDFLISIKTYGAQLCPSNDDLEQARVVGILKRIAEFVEPELYLYVACCKYRQKEAVRQNES